MRGALEAERAFEMLTLGAYYKYSSTAFVTFNSRVAESIAYQVLPSYIHTLIIFLLLLIFRCY